VQSLEALCRANGWSLLEDLTEDRSGRATPVGRVKAGNRDALLRLGIAPLAADTYVAFSGSGVTPEVYDRGVEDGVPWLLAEWVVGTPVLDAALTSDGSAVQALCDAAGAVARAVLSLPTLPAPKTAASEFSAEVRFIEAHMVVEGQLAKSAPPIHRLEADWTPAGRLHGDVTPANAIIDAAGNARLIDVTGDWGPVERSVAQWAAATIIAAQTREKASDTFDDYARDASDLCDVVCDAAGALDRGRLRRWTAEQLCRAAWEMSCSGEDFFQWRTIAGVAGSVWQAPGPSRSAKVPRNAPCSCGSGRKSKVCCAR